MLPSLPMPQPTTELLVDPAWLETRLGDPSVRIFDCTLTRIPQPSGASLWESGRNTWAESHIPGAFYLHMVDDLSAPKGTVPYGLPEPDAVAGLLSSFGVSADATIVLYGNGGQSVVHRVWWVLTASGVADVRVLDGGWQRWRGEDRLIESGVPPLPTAAEEYLFRPRPGMKVERDDVMRALGDPRTCLVHSLSAEQFAGTGGQVYRRAGRIPGSINIPASRLVNQDTACFRPIDELRATFAAAGVDRAETVVPYCGGGIAATTVFLGLAIAGYDNVRLYDGSLLDWTADPNAPMVADANGIDPSRR
jgi:thiosulfate/3-mercaptopyruvate sulfurtransferase